jgi:hypothetical protein
MAQIAIASVTYVLVSLRVVVVGILEEHAATLKALELLEHVRVHHL